MTRVSTVLEWLGEHTTSSHTVPRTFPERALPALSEANAWLAALSLGKGGSESPQDLSSVFHSLS